MGLLYRLGADPPQSCGVGGGRSTQSATRLPVPVPDAKGGRNTLLEPPYGLGTGGEVGPRGTTTVSEPRKGPTRGTHPAGAVSGRDEQRVEGLSMGLGGDCVCPW